MYLLAKIVNLHEKIFNGGKKRERERERKKED